MDRQQGFGIEESSAVLDGSDLGVPFEVKLMGVDLNLLVVLEALLACKNVTHAARRLGQTQPALSRALARLRDLLGDDLLVRSSNGMKLTARGEQLARAVPIIMSHVRDVIFARETMPGARVSINANLMPALFPHFLQSTAHENEPLKLGTHKSTAEGLSQLRSRTAEYLLGIADIIDSDIESQPVIVEDFVTLVAFERHNLGGVRPTETAFLALNHINLIDNGAEIFPQFAEAVTSHGVRRSRLFEVPDLTSAALMVSESDLALTVPRSIAGWLTKTLPLSSLLPPISIGELEVTLSWVANSEAATSRRLIDNIVALTREAVIRDQGSVRLLRAVSSEE